MSHDNMKSISIGNQTIKIKKGDSIMHNGNVYYFYAGDKRNLRPKGKIKRHSIEVPKADVSKIERIISSMNGVVDKEFNHPIIIITHYFF